MTDSRAAVGFDRLPWLPDQSTPPARRRGLRDVAAWAVAATLLIAGGAYWMGTQTDRIDDAERTTVQRLGPAATVKLPEPRPMPPAEEVRISPTPEVIPSPAPSLAVPRPRVERSATRKRLASRVRKRAASLHPREVVSPPATERKPSGAATTAAASTRPQVAALWPARQTKGASGRLVQIGAFGTPYQAKLGWRYMVRSYPAVRKLPAVVVEARNSKGRRFYRFQIGTTSQAHSEVLCQRIERIRLSCAVVGLRWKSRGVER